MNAPWAGAIVSVQPRVRLWRSFDERSLSYHGYVLRIDGICGGAIGETEIAVGRAAHAKRRFRRGMGVSGVATPVANPNTETAGWYKASRFKVLLEAEGKVPPRPPFHGVPPDLETYGERGPRRLDPRTYARRCATCIWGCRMPVTIILDRWNPSRRRYRVETFCYGPKSCRFYRAGRERTVPAKDGPSFTEGDWVDESATAHRGPDD